MGKGVGSRPRKGRAKKGENGECPMNFSPQMWGTPHSFLLEVTLTSFDPQSLYSMPNLAIFR